MNRAQRRTAIKLIAAAHIRARNRQIIKCFIDGMSREDIAARYKLTPSAVGKIKRGVSGGDATADLRKQLRAIENERLRQDD